MHIQTRWHKIINDIWGNKTRSLLVVLSIAVGVGVVGIINNARYMIEKDLYSQYEDGDPASVTIYTSPFQEDLLAEIAAQPDVQDVEAVRTSQAVVIDFDGVESELTLITVPDFREMSVNRVTVQDGFTTLGFVQLALERQTAEALGMNLREMVFIEFDGGVRYSLKVTTLVQNIYDMPYSINKRATGYINMHTLEWLGGQAYYNRLDIVVADNNHDRAHVLDVAARLRDEVIEPAGYYVGSIQIPGIDSNPGEHWAQNQISGFVLILQVMSVMAIFLSGGLVINTISAILTQQVKQIGIMRSIGAVPSQITGMFIFNVFVFSVIGWGLAIPIGMYGSYELAQFAANFLNFSVTGVQLSPAIFLLQTLLALLVPFGVALYPILAGTRIKVYDAIYQHGLVNEEQKPWLEKALARLKFLSPSSVLSLLNTFRNLPRLTITLITLILAGATFVAAFSTRTSLNAQIDEFFRYAQYDAAIDLTSEASKDTVEAAALAVEGVGYAEGWAQARGVVIRADGSQGDEIQIVGLSPDTHTIDPILDDGRWLEAGDQWQVVVNQDLVSQESGVQVGGDLEVEVNGKMVTFEVVGIASKHLVGPRIYLNYPMFAEIGGREDQVDTVRVRSSLEGIATAETQALLSDRLEEALTEQGLSTSKGQTQSDITDYFSEPFGIILMVLVVMAALLAVVGGLSLAGTMGINVMERTREIGVLRSVGASNSAIRQVVVLEGVTIAVISWLIVALISAPVSAALAGAVIYAILKTTLTFSFSFGGLFLWLGIIVIIGALSSLTPAGRAVRLTVREVLDYE